MPDLFLHEPLGVAELDQMRDVGVTQAVQRQRRVQPSTLTQGPEALVDVLDRQPREPFGDPQRRMVWDVEDRPGVLDLDAAAELADPVLLPALERLRTEWTGDDDAHSVAVSYAIARCEPATRDLAKRVEPQFVDAVNRALVELGWTIASSGEYPLTILTVRRPDGSLAGKHDATLLWDGVSPTDFNLAQEVGSWADAIRGMAAEASRMGPITDEDSAS